MDRPRLYRAQAEGVSRFQALPEPRRFLLAYGTGCGKTATALHCIEGAKRVIVVCPAMVRRHWAFEAARWLNEDLRPIEHGRHRKLPKRAALYRDAAYRATWRVVSYDLLPQLPDTRVDAIVLDEVHHVAHWSTRQSRAVLALVEANPGAAVLGLSATLVPTEVKQLWHPLRVLFGAKEWGEPPRTGECNWRFAERYCQIERNDYGSRVYGANEQRLPELRRRLIKVSHRLRREDIADDLPPLRVVPLAVEGTALSGPRHADATVGHALAWVRDTPPDVTHSVILTYHRDVARAIASELPGALYIDGSMPTDKRAEVLNQAEVAPEAVLVATSESIREGIRLMWAERVLFAQWRQSPVQVLQVLGRFQSVGDKRRPVVDVLIDESLYGASNALLRRTRAINALLTAGRVEGVVQEVFAPRELSEERMAALTLDLFATADKVEARSEWANEVADEF